MIQLVSLHGGKIFDVAGNAKDIDGNDIALTNLVGEPVSGDAGTMMDDDTSDNNVRFVTSSVVGNVGTVTFTAFGDGGKEYKAEAEVTIVADDVEPSEMSLTFTEVV